MNDVIRELESLKKEIESAKQEKAKAEGNIEALMKQLKEDFGIENIEDAQDTINKLGKEIETLSASLTTQFEEVKEKWEW